MKEDIEKFRKLCDILIREKDYTVNKISIESKISWPTMKKIRETQNIDDIKIHASVLGLIQDFQKKHCEDTNYAGIKPDPETVEKIRRNQADCREENKSLQPQKTKEKLDNIQSEMDEPKSKGEQKVVYKTFWDSMAIVHASLPENIQIIITISGKPK
jgi:hypothetical protein